MEIPENELVKVEQASGAFYPVPKNQNLPANPGFMDFSNLDNAIRCCEIICRSGLAPGAYKDRPEAALVAIQMGLEIGFKPLQSLQNIDVIQGKPSLRAEAMLALVQSSEIYEHCIETFDESTQTATCNVKRKGEPEHLKTFSMEDAQKAGLVSKGGPWKMYPKRMLQMRARSFALRDKFSDILYGLHTPEEIDVHNVHDVHSNESKAKFTHVGDKIKADLRSYIEPLPYAQPDADLLKKSIENTIEQIDHETGEIHPDPLDRLNDLIYEQGINAETIKKWLDRANVESLDDMPTDKIEKLIVMLEGDKK